MIKMFLFALVAGVSLSAQAANTQKCINRIESACRVSVWNSYNLDRNVQECKQVAPGLEAVLLKTGKVSVIDTRACVGNQYRVDGSGIKETKSIQNVLYMISNDGQAYFMSKDQALYEVLNSRGVSYSTIVDIAGVDSGRAVKVSMNNGQALVWDYSDLVSKAEKGQLRRLVRYNLSSFLGLFY